MTDARHDDIVQLTAFMIGAEEYVIDIMRVREIMRPVSITPVRHGPRYVEGVINLRGVVIPMIDMRRRFGLSSQNSPHRRFVILSVDGRTIGLIVDHVTDVVRVPRTSIRPAPDLFGGDRAPFFLGVCAYRDRDLILLNVKNIVTSDDEIVPVTEDRQSNGVGN